MEKIIIYQILTRLFSNQNATRKINGSISENGCGKFNDFQPCTLKAIKELGATHIWYTGVLEHATQTGYSDMPADSPSITKGKAGSPYAIRDYYDVDPDLATDTKKRMVEFENLITRTHKEKLKVIMDFIPNHVARNYHSDAKPKGTDDFGETDDTNLHFSPQNNFYYCPNEPFAPAFDILDYHESPAKATGNDCFHPSPSTNDWYETAKLNYGVDYTAGGQKHFDPIPDTWMKMRGILLYWAGKKVDGFRCDMAEMVPVEFWHWVIAEIKKQYPEMLFIAEVYNPKLYRSYIYEGGFDLLYDKVGLYDTLRGVLCNGLPAHQITHAWQAVDDIHTHMLHFLENHDEQRIASDFFIKNPMKAKPALIVSALLTKSADMIYFGQELGEQGMSYEGFSGCDGRTTIFDYWSLDKLIRWQNGNKFDTEKLTEEESALRDFYKRVFHLAKTEPALKEGNMYDLTWLNFNNPNYDTGKQFAWFRNFGKEIILLAVNFDDKPVNIKLNIPADVIHFLQIAENERQETKNLFTNKKNVQPLNASVPFSIFINANDGVALKFKTKKT